MKTCNEIRKFVSVLRLSHPHIHWMCIAYSISNASLPFISLYFSAEILNLLIETSYKEAFQMVLIMCLLLLISSLIGKGFYNQLQVVRRSASLGVDQALLKKAMVLEYERLENQETLDTLRRTRIAMNGSGDIASAIHFLMLSGETFCKIIFAMIAFIIMMFQIRTMDIYFLLLLLALFIFLLFKNRFSKKHGELLEELCNGNDRNNALTNYLLALFYKMENAKDIRLYKMDSIYKHKGKALMEDPVYVKFGKDNGRLMFWSDVIGQLLSFSAYVYVASLAIRSIISIGQVLYLSGIILNAVTSIAQFQSRIAQLRHQLKYLNAFYDFLQMPNMQYEGTLPIEKRDDGEYSFEFCHVSFAYPQAREPILKDINIKFHIKEKLAIVGMNGAGKTTIVKLLCRLYEPTSGQILLNGIDIAKYDYAQYTSIFSVVFQDFKLFSFELDENIAGGKDVNQEQLKNVLARLDIEKRIGAFRDREHSLLFKENGDGVNVSGGEAQKLAIARALYKDAPFVILDEPTAALDPISEAEIYEHFDLLVKDKTTLYISHRMSSCKFCDRIIVMDQGEIIEEGTHEELLLKEHIYADLWNAQAQYYTQ